MTSEQLLVVATLGGTLIGSLSSLLITYIQKRSEERKHFHETVWNMALAQWKEQIGIVKHGKGGGMVYPLVVDIVNVIKLSPLLTRKNLSNKEILAIIDDADKATAVVMKYAREPLVDKFHAKNSG